MYKYDVNYLFEFILKQTDFILRTTKGVNTHNDFMLSDAGQVLYHCTCMNLQSIGECVKQINDVTGGRLFNKFKDYPWMDVIGMRHFISHEYMSVDPYIVFRTIKTQLNSLKDNINKVMSYYNERKNIITDIQLIKQKINDKNKYYISCNIDGTKQMREEVDNKTIDNFILKNQTKFSKLPEPFKLAICWDIYDFQISLSQKENNGRKL